MYKIIIRNRNGTVHKSKIYESGKTFLKWWIEHTERYTWCGMKVEPLKHGRFGKWRSLTVGDIQKIEEQENAKRKRQAQKRKEKTKSKKEEGQKGAQQKSPQSSSDN